MVYVYVMVWVCMGERENYMDFLERPLLRNLETFGKEKEAEGMKDAKLEERNGERFLWFMSW